MKYFSSALLLVCASTAFAGVGAGYPKEHVAEFVVEKLDVTSLPEALWPRREKGKKTFRDYGFVASLSQENEFLLQAPGGKSNYSVKILQSNDSGIYACVAERSSANKEVSFQRVMLLRHKSPSDLLKGRESFRQFEGCVNIGDDPDVSPYGG